MHRCAKVLQIGVVLAMSALVLAGCGRRELLERKAASEIVVLQMDNQTTQKTVMTPAPIHRTTTTGSNATTSIAATPTATPETAAKTAAGNVTSDADIDRLMDDLGDTLNDLDALITSTDRDTLTDSVLITLVK